MPASFQVVHLRPGHLVGQPPHERPDQGRERVELRLVGGGAGMPLGARLNV